MVKYKQHSFEFKMKIALAAAKEIEGINDVAGKFEIHPKQVSEWKKKLLESAELVFDRKSKEEQVDKIEADLLKKIGQLSMEIDWLKKKLEKKDQQ